MKPITGIEPVFERWQRPVLTTIRHRQKLGYMRNLPRHILAPCQAALILTTMCNWLRVYHPAGLVQESNYHHTPLHHLGGLAGYLF